MPTNTKQQLCIKPTGFLVNILTLKHIALLNGYYSLGKLCHYVLDSFAYGTTMQFSGLSTECIKDGSLKYSTNNPVT